jgi:hypothetical protein
MTATHHILQTGNRWVSILTALILAGTAPAQEPRFLSRMESKPTLTCEGEPFVKVFCVPGHHNNAFGFRTGSLMDQGHWKRVFERCRFLSPHCSVHLNYTGKYNVPQRVALAGARAAGCKTAGGLLGGFPFDPERQQRVYEIYWDTDFLAHSYILHDMEDY